jgi:hypothetical protein
MSTTRSRGDSGREEVQKSVSQPRDCSPARRSGRRFTGIRLLCRGAIPFLFVLLLGISTAHAGQRPLQGTRTWVFVVGTLEWQDNESFSGFPTKDRRDAELVQTFRDAGVPKERLVYLVDRQATTKRIDTELRAMLAKTAPGDLLFLYYCGHGYKDDNGRAFFASYDASDDVAGWPMASVPALIEAGFKGSMAILAADCCYSGALGAAVQRQAKRVPMACLTSSSASQLSTGNWTFTEALLDGLRGAPGCDANGDGTVTLEEIGTYIRQDMAWGEEQLSTFTAAGGFDRAFPVMKAGARANERVGQRVEVTYDGALWKARVVETRPGEVKLHWLGTQGYADEWVKASTVVRTMAAALSAYRVGQAVEVEWKKKWYPAKVLRLDGQLALIHYTGYDESWDEWVGPKRIREAK